MGIVTVAALIANVETSADRRVKLKYPLAAQGIEAPRSTGGVQPGNWRDARLIN
jgi:hypothetical protein